MWVLFHLTYLLGSFWLPWACMIRYQPGRTGFWGAGSRSVLSAGVSGRGWPDSWGLGLLPRRGRVSITSIGSRSSEVVPSFCYLLYCTVMFVSFWTQDMYIQVLSRCTFISMLVSWCIMYFLLGTHMHIVWVSSDFMTVDYYMTSCIFWYDYLYCRRSCLLSILGVSIYTFSGFG